MTEGTFTVEAVYGVVSLAFLMWSQLLPQGFCKSRLEMDHASIKP
jgi:hypothetical protein